MATLTYQQVKNIVKRNNNSKFSTSILICLIWKESNFITNAKNAHSSATGLMMITRGAVEDVNANTRQGIHFEHSEMTNAERNVSCGTHYLAILRRRHPTNESALEHFGTGKGYAKKLFDCEKCLKKSGAGTNAHVLVRKIDCLRIIHP